MIYIKQHNSPHHSLFFFFNDTAPTEIYPLPLHDALPISPSKSFSLRHNNSELLTVTPVATLRERVFQVFGAQTLDDLVDLGDQGRDLMLPVDGPDEEAITRRFRLRGFVSGPQVQKLNRNSVFLFVNGRLIQH